MRSIVELLERLTANAKFATVQSQHPCNLRADEAVLNTVLLCKEPKPLYTSPAHTTNSIINMCNTAAHTHIVDLIKE